MSHSKNNLSSHVDRCPGDNWKDIIASDTRTPPAALTEDKYQYLGSESIAASRYTSADFFADEVEKMWPNVWQFAARDEELPNPGDYIVYENAGRSFLLVRQEDGSVKALHNVCLHRGRKLATGSGRATRFVCAFHGFAWNNDGSLNDIPCRWDFKHLSDEKMQLPEAEVGHWGGYIFVRDNPGGPTLEEYLAPLPEHFKDWNHEECVTAAWVGKVVHANWKITMEAFMESYHAYVTHPQLMPFTGDANSAYNVLSDHVNANLTPFGTPSPHIKPEGEQWIIEQFLQYNGRSADNYDPEKDNFNVTVADDQTARQALAESLRTSSERAFGRDYSNTSDAELLDALVYNVFPNFSPWGGFMPNIVYRWRPWPDQDHCLMEVRVLTRVKPGEPKPQSVPMHMLGEDESWSAAPELGVLGAVVDQDMSNMSLVHDGLKASKNGLVELGDYQEVRIRHFHQTLNKYLAK
ncbi:MAG: aromatic ring-hydroxylating dioxygenase subunit alpha [Spongiibacteraceae bacterium]